MEDNIKQLKQDYKKTLKSANSKEEKTKIKSDYKSMKRMLDLSNKIIENDNKDMEKFDKVWDKFDKEYQKLGETQSFEELKEKLNDNQQQFEEQKKYSEEVMNKFDELKNKLDAKLGTTNSQEIYEVNNSKNNYSVEDISHNSTNDNKISLVVSNMLSDEVYDAINDLEMISLNLGEIEFFSRNEIDEAQKGFRFNPNTNEIINDWIGNNYIIIGYDCTAGFGPEPLIIKIDNPDYPIYWLMTDGGDWEKPIKVADSLTIFTTAYKKLLDYKTLLESNSLTAEECNSLILEIEKIVNSSNISWWKNLVMSSCL